VVVGVEIVGVVLLNFIRFGFDPFSGPHRLLLFMALIRFRLKHDHRFDRNEGAVQKCLDLHCLTFKKKSMEPGSEGVRESGSGITGSSTGSEASEYLYFLLIMLFVVVVVL
jgi:hypothetical protein